MDFDTVRLRSFLHVAELGTVTAAAAALGFTGPAVSQHVTRLEAQLGASLFDRVGGRLRLSERGMQLLPLARGVIDLADSAPEVLDVPPEGRRVRVTAVASAIRAIVVPAWRALPGIDWDVQEAEDDDALRALRLGHADIAVVQEYDGAPEVRDQRLHYTVVAQDRLRLLAPPGTRPSIRLEALASEGWLVNGAGTRCEAATERVLAAAGIAPRVVGRVGDTATLFSLVASGYGATIAPELMLSDARSKVVLCRADLGVTRRLVLVQRASVRSVNADIVRALREAGRKVGV